VRVEPELPRAPPLVAHPAVEAVVDAEGVVDGVEQAVDVVVRRVPHVLLAYLVAVRAVARRVREVRELGELRSGELRRPVRHHLAALREDGDALAVHARRPVGRIPHHGVGVHLAVLHNAVVRERVEEPVRVLVRAVERRRHLRRRDDRAAPALQHPVEAVRREGRVPVVALVAAARVLLVVGCHWPRIAGRG